MVMSANTVFELYVDKISGELGQFHNRLARRLTSQRSRLEFSAASLPMTSAASSC